MILIHAVSIYSIIVFVNVILSWIIHSSRSMTIRQIYLMTNRLVDPVLQPIRRVIGPMTHGFGIDISPIILLVLLQVLGRMLEAIFSPGRPI